MKKETARMIKTAAAGIVMLAAVICYNVEWKGSGDTAQFHLTALQEETAEEGTDALAPAGVENHSPEYGGNTGDSERDNGAGRIFVHVCGEVAAPGVYEMKEGSRIYQAVEMAGGLTENAAGDFLNMAGKLEDGMKIQIPDREEAVQWSREAAAYPGISAGADGGAVTSKINLNTAVKEQLMTLKGIGEARAEAIIAYRQEYGPFARIEDIMEVPGIKEAAFQKIKEDITV